MLNDNAKKWVKALRSGEYTKGIGFLSIDGCYCCLGVACEIYRKENPDEFPVNTMGYEDKEILRYGEKTTELPTQVKDWLGLNTVDGRLKNGGVSDWLVNINDDLVRDLTFDEIADFIESEPKELFKEPEDVV